MQTAYKCNVEQTEPLVWDCSSKKRAKSIVELTHPSAIFCSTQKNLYNKLLTFGLILFYEKRKKSHVEQTYPQGIICSTPLDVSTRTDSSSSY